MTSADADGIRRTPLYERHVALGARMVPFAGYEMPVQYKPGIVAEHNHTRTSAGLFDVSHMGQARLVGPDHQTTASALERLIPASIVDLEPGQQRYSQLLNETGGIIDDLMVQRPADGPDGTLLLVVNAACKEGDYAHLKANLPANVTLEEEPDLALLALQGPKAEVVLESLVPGVAGLDFMQGAGFDSPFGPLHATRSGYTGEDGFEISIPASAVGDLWDALNAHDDVMPIGLGARDSLRLEAGLCLYGHDIDDTTSPVEAGLLWSIQKRRREEGGFPGAERIQREIAEGPARKRVGIRPEGRAPAREGTEIQDARGNPVGTVTSGGFGPTVGGPVAMGYVAAAFAGTGTPVNLLVRGKALAAEVAPLAFVKRGYKR